MLAYDDLYSIQYMRKNLRPYWRRNGWEAADLLKAAAKDYESLKQRCAAFDDELMADVTKAGGEKYAKLCALAYRQCLAAGKFVADDHGQPLQFCKENHSNGCIGTVDVLLEAQDRYRALVRRHVLRRPVRKCWMRRRELLLIEELLTAEGVGTQIVA